jgi:uncharacterized protein (DUF983 family)
MQDNRIDRPSQAPRWWQVARHGRCPACAAPGMVWAGRVWEPPKLADHCRACGQPFAEHEASGRALYPVVIPLVALLVFSALRVDDIWRLPLWVYPLVWAGRRALWWAWPCARHAQPCSPPACPPECRGKSKGKQP